MPPDREETGERNWRLSIIYKVEIFHRTRKSIISTSFFNKIKIACSRAAPNVVAWQTGWLTLQRTRCKSKPVRRWGTGPSISSRFVARTGPGNFELKHHLWQILKRKNALITDANVAFHHSQTFASTKLQRKWHSLASWGNNSFELSVESKHGSLQTIFECFESLKSQ